MIKQVSPSICSAVLSQKHKSDNVVVGVAVEVAEMQSIIKDYHNILNKRQKVIDLSKEPNFIGRSIMQLSLNLSDFDGRENFSLT